MGTADKDYFLDDQGQVTTDEAKAALLLIRKGQDIPKEMADKYGLGGNKVARQTAEKPAVDEADEAEADSDEKAAAKPANKKATPSKNKGAK